MACPGGTSQKVLLNASTVGTPGDFLINITGYFPYGKKCTAANNFREQLANALRILCEYSAIAR